MNHDVVSRLSLYAKEKTTLTPDQREEINQILDELVQKCKEINTGQIGAAAHNPQEFRESIPYDVFEDLAALGDYWLLIHDELGAVYQIICNLCRFGRNATITCRRNQDFMSESGLLLVAVSILQEEVSKICDRKPEVDIVLICLALQMVCNCMVCNVEATKNLTKQYNLFDTVLAIVESFDDEKACQYAAITGYTIVDLMGFGSDVNVKIIDRPEFLEILMNKLNEEPFRLWFSALVGADGFLSSMLQESMSEELRIRLIKSTVKYEIPLPDESVICVRDLFKEMTGLVVRAEPAEVEGLITEELASLLDLLALLSSDHENSRTECLLQNDHLFVDRTNRLLRTVHVTGKESNNSLTPLEKIEEVQNAMSNSEVASTPTYHFKSNLIRLMGNLAYKHKSNQAVALELETLPIVLECTKIDGRNPFAPQCAIFAMRVLLEDNVENQKFVAKMNKISKVYK